VTLQPAHASAALMAERLDQMNAGPEAVQLSWRGDTALLAVHTMMGRDTVAAIGAAYREITARPARALVIDLRRNEGGAFAAVPLVGHLLAQPLTAASSFRGAATEAGPRARSEVENGWRPGAATR
jgi:carboxyl-terminal processing protease